MRGTLGFRVPSATPSPMAAPTINLCPGLEASWPAYTGAASYDLQWGTGPSASAIVPTTTITGATSPRVVRSRDDMTPALLYGVRVRAVLAGGTVTPWGPWATAYRDEQPWPPNAALTAGVAALTVASPADASAVLYSLAQYDAEVQYSYDGSTWAAFTEWYETPLGSAVSYSVPPSGVYYRARVRYRGTRCSSSWVGSWGAWSAAAFVGAAGGGAGGELGGE